MSDKVVTGASCGNCKFFAKRPLALEELRLNAQGGTGPENHDERRLARRADLVTLPGNAPATKGKMCAHPHVAQAVTDRMCCAFWDAPGTLRSY